jgi:hypothetical protein
LTEYLEPMDPADDGRVVPHEGEEEDPAQNDDCVVHVLDVCVRGGREEEHFQGVSIRTGWL